jgi:cytosine/adenosine deaminase-related metal-dependent hydrolase
MRLLIVARNRTVAVEDDRIVAADGGFDQVLRFPYADVRPGLINAHDHLHRNHYGRLGKPPYPNAYSWARDIQARYPRHIARGRRRPRREALLTGAWKNLFAGVTSVVHHDAWEPDFEADFPLRVARICNADSIGMAPSLEALRGDGGCCIHLAEGIDGSAAEEVRILAALDMLKPDLIAVHGVGMDRAGVAQFRDAGAALVWCPTSNQFLFDRTAPDALLREGVDVLLGSDSRLTGTGDLLDELRHARLHGTVSEERLEKAVGAIAAQRLSLPMPSLEPGSNADLIVLSRPITDACAEDVALVLAAGVPRVARPELAPFLEPLVGKGRQMRVGSVTRWTSTDRPVATKGRSS